MRFSDQLPQAKFYNHTFDLPDGYDTVDWVVAQPWANGRVGTVGTSYDGFTALAAAVDQPAVRVVLADEPPADASYGFDGGVPWMSYLAWVAMQSTGQNPLVPVGVASNSLHPSELDMMMAGQIIPAWQDEIRHPHPSDAYWKNNGIVGVYSKICAPTFLVYAADPLQRWRAPMDVWEGLRNGCPTASDLRLVAGSGVHGIVVASLPYGHQTSVGTMALQFLDHYLVGTPLDPSPAVWFASQIGRAQDQWSKTDSFPPHDVWEQGLYLDCTAEQGSPCALMSVPALDSGLPPSLPKGER